MQARFPSSLGRGTLHPAAATGHAHELQNVCHAVCRHRRSDRAGGGCLPRRQPACMRRRTHPNLRCKAMPDRLFLRPGHERKRRWLRIQRPHLRIRGHGRDAGSAVSTTAALRRVANYEGYMLRRPVGLALYQGPLKARVFAASSPPPIGRPLGGAYLMPIAISTSRRHCERSNPDPEAQREFLDRTVAHAALRRRRSGTVKTLGDRN